MKFIDLFAGVGGFRIACEINGMECVFSSENDKYARETYKLNFGEYPSGDITKIDAKDIPDHDILCAGFPCQPFSVAGKRKGFKDERSNVFFDIIRILKKKNPKYFILENVKALKFREEFKNIILKKLENCGYKVLYFIMNAKDYTVPQNRERLFLIGFKNEFHSMDYEFPKKNELKISDGFSMFDLFLNRLEAEVDTKYYYKDDHKNKNLIRELKNNVKKGLTAYSWRRSYVREIKGNVCPTLTANMGTGGHNVPIIRDCVGIRKLTPRECFNFQGFPDNFMFPKGMSDGQLYKQAGNAVSVEVADRIITNLMKVAKINHHYRSWSWSH